MTTPLSNAYADTQFELKHIVPLDFNSIHELPKSHEWTLENDHLSKESTFRVSETITLPVIDLAMPNALELMKNACQKWGMFYVANHGVPSSLINDVESHAQRLFALPSEQKFKALRSSSGPTGYGAAWISPFFKKLMWHEGFTIMGSAVEDAKQLWPNDYEEFCDVIDNYQRKMKSLAHKLLHLILKALGEDEDQESSSIDISSFFQSDGALQLNSYPTCPNPNQAMGLAPHTDTLFLTILHQNDTNGLQIFQEGMGWLPVPPVPDALLINIGDLMHILSNGRFPAVYHRVFPNEIKQRISFAYFYGPPIDSIVAPLSKLPCFKPVVVKEFIGLKNKYLEKAIDMVRA